jgi:hypothetical protein
MNILFTGIVVFIGILNLHAGSSLDRPVYARPAAGFATNDLEIPSGQYEKMEGKPVPLA